MMMVWVLTLLSHIVLYRILVWDMSVSINDPNLLYTIYELCFTTHEYRRVGIVLISE